MRRERTYLYRARDHEGTLLYIGITDMPRIRQATHAKHAPWRDLATGEWEWQEFASREEAEEAERQEIAEHRPPFNTRGNPDKLRQAIDLVRVNIPVEAETRRMWKLAAIDRQTTLAQLIHDAMTNYLATTAAPSH